MKTALQDKNFKYKDTLNIALEILNILHYFQKFSYQ